MIPPRPSHYQARAPSRCRSQLLEQPTKRSQPLSRKLASPCTGTFFHLIHIRFSDYSQRSRYPHHFFIDKYLKRFNIHKEFACAATPVFNAAFNSGFVEGKTQTNTIKDITTETFQFLSQWMHTNSLDVTSLRPEIYTGQKARDDTLNDLTDSHEPYDLLCLWALAGRLLIP